MSQTRMAGISHVGTKETSKGPLFQVTTSDGVEYSTFNGALANQARQLVGQNVELAFTEKHVNKDGRDYVNRYYDGAQPTNGGVGSVTFGNAPATGIDMPQLAFAPPQPFTTSSSAPEGDRETRIMRQTATKVAAHMLGYLPEQERTPDGLIAIAEYLVSYYQNGPQGADYVASDDIPF